VLKRARDKALVCGSELFHGDGEVAAEQSFGSRGMCRAGQRGGK
jgi:hypothetical protein